jgi:uncharacterized lipoprotein YddW (UPF0748 family)
MAWVGLLCALATTAAAAPAEVRGLWVVRTGLVSPEAVDRVIDQAVAGGFNTLLVQVRGRGDAFYRSDLVPRSVLLTPRQAGFDPLAHLLQRARAHQLQVHAWVNVLLSAHFGQPMPADHMLLEHPEWVMVPRKAARAGLRARGKDLLRLVAETSSRADVEGYYVSPAAPGVPAHLESVVRELLQRYPVDGLHLDFIRYPSADFDYSRAALEAYQRQHGGGLLDVVARPTAAWDEHRRRVLTALAERLSAAARRERPGLPVSAAVVPSDVEAVQRKFQSWPAWVESGIVDAVCPMAYTPDAQLFRAQIEQARLLVPAREAVWAGVGAYRLTIDGIVRNIQAARQLGAAGVVLFSHESLDGPSLDALRRQAFAPPAVEARMPVRFGDRVLFRRRASHGEPLAIAGGLGLAHVD